MATNDCTNCAACGGCERIDTESNGDHVGSVFDTDDEADNDG